MSGIAEQNQVREEGADGEPEERAEHERVHLRGEEADDDAGENALDSRPDDDADNLRTHLGREPRRHAVEDPEKAAEQRREQWFLQTALRRLYYTCGLTVFICAPATAAAPGRPDR